MTADEQVQMYSDLIAAERRRIKEAQKDIARYAYELERAARGALAEQED